MRRVLIIVLTVILLVSCTSVQKTKITIIEKKLVTKNGVTYEEGSATPFNGYVTVAQGKNFVIDNEYKSGILFRQINSKILTEKISKSKDIRTTEYFENENILKLKIIGSVENGIYMSKVFDGNSEVIGNFIGTVYGCKENSTTEFSASGIKNSKISSLDCLYAYSKKTADGWIWHVDTMLYFFGFEETYYPNGNIKTKLSYINKDEINTEESYYESGRFISKRKYKYENINNQKVKVILK